MRQRLQLRPQQTGLKQRLRRPQPTQPRQRPTPGPPSAARPGLLQSRPPRPQNQHRTLTRTRSDRSLAPRAQVVIRCRQTRATPQCDGTRGPREPWSPTRPASSSQSRGSHSPPRHQRSPACTPQASRTYFVRPILTRPRRPSTQAAGRLSRLRVRVQAPRCDSRGRRGRSQLQQRRRPCRLRRPRQRWAAPRGGAHSTSLPWLQVAARVLLLLAFKRRRLPRQRGARGACGRPSPQAGLPPATVRRPLPCGTRHGSCRRWCCRAAVT